MTAPMMVRANTSWSAMKGASLSLCGTNAAQDFHCCRWAGKRRKGDDHPTRPVPDPCILFACFR